MATEQILYMKSDGVGGSKSWDVLAPTPGTVTITGSGFGLPPNVVLYRSLNGVEGNTVSLSPLAGEIGTLSQSNMKHGDGGAIGFSSSINNTLEFIAPQQFKNFRISTSLKVPDGSYPPGRDNANYRTWSTDSGWKPVWVMLSDDGDASQWEPDICLPTHTGSSRIAVAGNTLSTEFTYQNSNQYDHWSWDVWNTFNFTFTSGVTPQVSPALHACYMTSPNLGKGYGTKTYTFVGDQIGAFYNQHRRFEFSAGGPYQPVNGEYIKGATSSVVSKTNTSSQSFRLLSGSWSNSDASGYLSLNSSYLNSGWVAGERVGTWPAINGDNGSVVNANVFTATTGQYLPLLFDNECFFDRIKYNAYARTSSTSPELTQAVYKDLYLAIQSSIGVEDYKQMAFIGNSSIFGNCTKIKPKYVAPANWSDTSVTIPISADEKSEYTHAFIQKSNGDITVGVSIL